MEQNDRLEKNKDFFQGKELFNTKLLQSEKVTINNTTVGHRYLQIQSRADPEELPEPDI